MSRDNRRGIDGTPRPDSGAIFTSRVGGSKGRPPFFAIAFVAVLAGVVAIGVGGRIDAGSASQAGGGVPSAGAGAGASPGATLISLPGGPVARPGRTPDRSPMVTSGGDGPLQLQVRRYPDAMFIHGDVYAANVSWVFLNILDSEGRVAGWSSISAPAGITPRDDDMATMRFDLEHALPDRSNGPLWVQATVYALGGTVVATERLGVWPDGNQVIEEGDEVEGSPAVGGRARPGVFFPLLDASWEDVRSIPTGQPGR